MTPAERRMMVFTRVACDVGGYEEEFQWFDEQEDKSPEALWLAFQDGSDLIEILDQLVWNDVDRVRVACVFAREALELCAKIIPPTEAVWEALRTAEAWVTDQSVDLETARSVADLESSNYHVRAQGYPQPAETVFCSAAFAVQQACEKSVSNAARQIEDIEKAFAREANTDQDERWNAYREAEQQAALRIANWIREHFECPRADGELGR